MVVDIVIKKYGSHLPVYRQQADLDRDFGIDLSRSTLNGAIIAAGELLVPVVKTLKADLFAGAYIQADETPIGVQSAKTEGRNHQAYEFQYSRPGGPVVFDFQMSRGRDGPANFLGKTAASCNAMAMRATIKSAHLKCCEPDAWLMPAANFMTP